MNEELEALSSLLTFNYAGKEFKGICVPIEHLELEYDDDMKVIKTTDAFMEEQPIVTEYYYDDNKNCTITKSYKTGLIKPKDSDVVISTSEYDDQNRLVYVNSPLSERTIEYFKDGSKAIKEKDKNNGYLKTIMVSKDDTITHQLVSVNGIEQSELYRDYESDLAKKYEGFDEVRLEKHGDDGLVEVGRTTFNKNNRVVKITSIEDYHIFELYKEYDEEHDNKIVKETAYCDGEKIDEITHEHNFDTDEYIVTGRDRRVVKIKGDGYYKIEQYDLNLKDELTMTVFEFNNQNITFLYTNGNISTVEYVDPDNDLAFAYKTGYNDNNIFHLMDADVRIGDEAFKFIKDNSPSGYRYIYQKLNGKYLLMQNDIAANSDELNNFINSKVLEFINNNDMLKVLIKKEGGIDIEKQFTCGSTTAPRTSPMG